MDRSTGLVAVACALSLSIAACGSAGPETSASTAGSDSQQLRWGAGGEGSINAEAALAASHVLRSNGAEVYTVNSGGTIDSLLAMANGELDLANADNTTLPKVWEGRDGFDQIQGFSQVSSGFTTFFYFITLEDSGIQTLADFEGKTLNGHTPGAILNIFNDDMASILYEEGVVPEGSIETSELALSDAIDALQDGRIDIQTGYSFAGSLPTWLEQAATRNLDLTSIPIPQELHGPLKEKDYVVVDDPTVDEFRRLDPDIAEGPFHTAGIVTIMVASDDTSEDAVYEILKTWDANSTEIAAAHPANKVYEDQTYFQEYLLDGLPVHPGAEKFFKEISGR